MKFLKNWYNYSPMNLIKKSVMEYIRKMCSSEEIERDRTYLNDCFFKTKLPISKGVL